MIIQIDITDWAEEAESVDSIHTREDIIDALERGLSTGVIARATIVDRERGVADIEVIPENKALLNLGAQLEISKVARREKKDVVADSGKVYQTRALVGKVRGAAKEGAGGGKSYVHITEHAARERAEDYILNVVPGHIWPRLLIIQANGGDVEEITDELKSKINAQIRKIKYDKVATQHV